MNRSLETQKPEPLRATPFADSVVSSSIFSFLSPFFKEDFCSFALHPSKPPAADGCLYGIIILKTISGTRRMERQSDELPFWKRETLTSSVARIAPRHAPRSFKRGLPRTANSSRRSVSDKVPMRSGFQLSKLTQQNKNSGHFSTLSHLKFHFWNILSKIPCFPAPGVSLFHPSPVSQKFILLVFHRI